MDGHDGGGGGDLGVGHGHGVDLGFSSHDHGSHSGIDHDGNHAGHVTAEAMMVAHSHCHSHDGMVGHFGGDIDGADLNHGHIGGWSHGEGIDPAKAQRIKRMLAAVEKAKLDPQRRYYGAHIVGHGYAEIPAIFTRAALEAGLMRICNTVANFNPVDLTDTVLSDWSRFSPPYSRTNTPAGFYPNAAGLTRVFKQYWQVADKKRWWVQGDKPKFDRTKSTYVEVSIVTWFFADIGDYETRIDITVVSLPVLDRSDKVWARRKTPLQTHQLAAEQVCHRLFEALKAIPPTAYTLGKRKSIIAQQAEEARRAAARNQPNLPKVGQSGADLDSLFGATDPLESLEPEATAVVAKVPAGVVVTAPAQPVIKEETPVTAQPDAVQPADKPAGEPAADEKMVPVEVTIPPPRMKKPDQDA
ncbi:MAG: hypothetical protein WCT03_19135 [Candidatus Obscuribacterales bacterium]